MTPPPLKYKTREIVSEYGYSALRDSPSALHEFREVTKVDGRQVMTQETARRTLTLGVTSAVLFLTNDEDAAPKSAGAPPRTAKKKPVRIIPTPFITPSGGGAGALVRF